MAAITSLIAEMLQYISLTKNMHVSNYDLSPINAININNHLIFH